MSLHDALDLWEHSFFAAPCPLAISVAKIARKGKTLELTGEDAYRSLTLPLMKAADHLKQISKPEGKSDYFAFRMIVCLAVLRAPMFGAFRSNETEVTQPLPWVRVCRLEPWQSGLPFRTTSNVRYYDVVHEDYLPKYMSALIEDAKSIARRIEKAADVIASGKGVSKLNDETTYRTLRALTSEDKVPDDLEPKFRISRLAPGFNLPQQTDPGGVKNINLDSEPSS